MVNVFMHNGNVMAMLIVMMGLMNLTVVVETVVLMINLTVVMVNVSLQVLSVMDHLIRVTQVGVLTVPMAQMKV